MNQQTKVLASVAGVCIPLAVIGGVVFAVINGHETGRTPAGNEVSVSVPASVPASTVTVTATPSPVQAAKATPAKKAAPKRQAVQQGDPVTNPQPADQQPVQDPTTTAPVEQIIDQGTGTVDQGGVRRAPAPVQKVHSVPVPPPLPLGPGAPTPTPNP